MQNNCPILSRRLFGKQERSCICKGHDGEWILQEYRPAVWKVQFIQMDQEQDQSTDEKAFEQIEGQVD